MVYYTSNYRRIEGLKGRKIAWYIYYTPNYRRIEGLKDRKIAWYIIHQIIEGLKGKMLKFLVKFS